MRISHFSRVGKIGIATLLSVAVIMALGGAYLLVQPTDAAALSSRKDTLQDSRHGQLSRHTFVFTTATALTTDSTSGADFSFVLNFPTNAGADPYGTSVPNFVAGDVTATCTSCGSQVMAVTEVEESSNGGHAANDEFLIAINETGQDSNPLPASSVVTLTFGASSGAQRLTNPADDAAGCTAGADATYADICSITVATSETTTGASPTAVDSASVLVAHIAGVAVSVTVAESLSFRIQGIASGSCTGDTGSPTTITTTSSTVPFGSIATPNAFFAGCQDLTVSTNASGGYVVTAEENTSLLAGSTTLDDTTCDSSCSETSGTAWATNTNNGLGFFCADQTGTDCSDGVDTISEYRQFACTGSDANCDPGTGAEAAQNVMQNTGAVSNNIGRIHYKLSVSGVQPAGTYSNTVIYIATPTF